MDAMLSLLHAVSAAAAAALVMGVVEGMALTAAVGVVLRLCPGLSAGARSAVWTAALGISILLPAGSLLRSHDGAETVRGVAQVGTGWALALVGVWALLSAVRLTMLAVGAIRLRQVWLRATPIEASAGCQELLEAAGRRAELCVSDDVDRPSVVGFLRPRVLLPAELPAELGPEEMEHIIRHEMQHLQRRDDWTNLAQKLSLVAFPLNPVLFWLDRRLCQERELACDDGVLRRTRAPKAYAACLANLAENRLAAKGLLRRGSALALGAWARETELSRRVHRILSWRESALERRSAAVMAGALMLSVAVGGLELARCPELLRFTGEPTGLAEVSSPVAGSATGTAEGLASASGDAMGVPVLTRASSLGAAKPMLVNAAMPEPVRGAEPRRAVGKSRRAARSVAGHRLGMRTSLRKTQMPLRRRAELRPAPRVVMTAWRTDEFPARLVLTVAGEDVSTGETTGDDRQRYAAFATRDGWLFVSL